MNYASTVNLSSGQILFGDPTKPWNRSQMPQLPSTSLGLTARGTVESASFQTLSLSNAISYEPFEESTLRASLEKTLVVDTQGHVSYVTQKLTHVSTVNAVFHYGISSFASSTIAGPNIQDLSSPTPDTITNALAKIDDWLKTAFLIQPPCVTPVERTETSLFGAIRWLNFPVLNILNGTIPYITGILFVIGDPETENLTFEWSDPSYFPQLSYTNGITPVLNPIVQLRLFTDFFPQIGEVAYSKESLGGSCFTLLNNNGAFTLPGSGRVFSVQTTDHYSTYTTLNIYLPQLGGKYPKNTDIPIRVVFMNRTASPYNVCYMSTSITTSSGPSPPNTTISTTSESTITYTIDPPALSDTAHNREEQWFSSYTIRYRWNSWTTVKDTTSGFLYGAQDLTSMPSFYSTYLNYKYEDVPSYTSTLVVEENGTSNAPILPGTVWETSVRAINAGLAPGLYGASLYASTLVPSTTTSTLSNIALDSTAPYVGNCAFELSTNGTSWSIGSNIPYDLAYISSPTQIPIAALTEVQFNNASYPGDRNPIRITSIVGDLSTVLTMTPSSYDYAIGVPYSTNLDSDVKVVLSDPSNQHLFYDAQLTALPKMSSYITSVSTSVSLILQNTYISSTIEQAQSTTSASYGFGVDRVGNFQYVSSGFLNQVTECTYVSGILTPSRNADLLFTAYQSNQFFNTVCSSFGNATLFRDDDPTGPTIDFTSSIVLLSNGTPVLSTPMPANTLLQYSTLTMPVGSVYQDPSDPQNFFISTVLVSPYPQSLPQSQVIVIPSTFFADTVSVAALSNFTTPESIYGQHLRGYLPRSDISTLEINIQDGVNPEGQTDIGLNVPFSSYITLTSSFSTLVDTSAYYNNTEQILSNYPSTYCRELILTGGQWKHPADLQFNTFSGADLNCTTYTYPDFCYDLIYDENNGFRYATFLYKTYCSTPTMYRYLDITLDKPTIVSTITDTEANPCFPNTPVDDAFLQYTTTKMHVKLFASYEQLGYQTIETAWANGFNLLDNYFDDTVYDIGACVSVSTFVSSIRYRVAITPRYYTNLNALIRIGISRLRNQETGEGVAFDGARIEYLC